jgi:hypothetical protein
MALDMLITGPPRGKELVAGITAEEDGVLKRLLSLRKTRRAARHSLSVCAHLGLLLR